MKQNSQNTSPPPLYAVVPAAGVGKRMQQALPKQYLPLLGKTLLEHAVTPLLQHPKIASVVIALNADDCWFPNLPLATHPKVKTVLGGAERSDSVLAGLSAIPQENAWVLVHDAVRPCLSPYDLNHLIEVAMESQKGTILAYKEVDTIKQAQTNDLDILHTVERSNLWHALTPQIFPVVLLREALSVAKQHHNLVTDESSAVELLGYSPRLLAGNKKNIKVTTSEDLALAHYYLTLGMDI